MEDITLKLPASHALDWLARYDGDGVELVGATPRTATLTLRDEALTDLISDAHYYAEEMGRDHTGDLDYRPAARRCLAGLERSGVRYSREGFRVTLK